MPIRQDCCCCVKWENPKQPWTPWGPSEPATAAGMKLQVGEIVSRGDLNTASEYYESSIIAERAIAPGSGDPPTPFGFRYAIDNGEHWVDVQVGTGCVTVTSSGFPSFYPVHSAPHPTGWVVAGVPIDATITRVYAAISRCNDLIVFSLICFNAEGRRVWNLDPGGIPVDTGVGSGGSTGPFINKYVFAQEVPRWSPCTTYSSNPWTPIEFWDGCSGGSHSPPAADKTVSIENTGPTELLIVASQGKGERDERERIECRPTCVESVPWKKDKCSRYREPYFGAYQERVTVAGLPGSITFDSRISYPGPTLYRWIVLGLDVLNATHVFPVRDFACDARYADTDLRAPLGQLPYATTKFNRWGSQGRAVLVTVEVYASTGGGPYVFQSSKQVAASWTLGSYGTFSVGNCDSFCCRRAVLYTCLQVANFVASGFQAGAIGTIVDPVPGDSVIRYGACGPTGECPCTSASLPQHLETFSAGGSIEYAMEAP